MGDGYRAVSIYEVLKTALGNHGFGSRDEENGQGVEILSPAHVHTKKSEEGIKRTLSGRLIKREAVGTREEQKKIYEQRAGKYFENASFAMLPTEHNIISETLVGNLTIHSSEVSIVGPKREFGGDVLVYSPEPFDMLINDRIAGAESAEKKQIEHLYNILKSGGTVVLAHPAFLPYEKAGSSALPSDNPEEFRESAESLGSYKMFRQLIDMISAGSEDEEEKLDMLSRIGIEIYNATRSYEFSMNTAVYLLLNEYAAEKMGKTGEYLLTPVAGSDSHVGAGMVYGKFRISGGKIYIEDSFIISESPEHALSMKYHGEVVAREGRTFRPFGIPVGMLVSRDGSNPANGISKAIIMEGMKLFADMDPNHYPYHLVKGKYIKNGGLEAVKRLADYLMKQKKAYPYAALA